MKSNKICLSKYIFLLIIVILIGVYFYKGGKEGFARLANIQNRASYNTNDPNQPNPNPTNPIGMPKPYEPVAPPSSVKSCDMMTSYGSTNCNNTITTSHVKCRWNGNPKDYLGNPINNSVGGICETVY